MSCCSRRWLSAATAAAAVFATVNPAAANPLIVGLGAEVDDADNLAYSLFADVGLLDDTWLSASLARTESDRGAFDLSTLYADIGIDHHFKPVGVRLGAAYWGDDDLLDSRDIRGSVYLRGEKGSVSVDYQRRNFDLTIGGGMARNPVSVDFSADGIGLSASMPLNERFRIYAGGMDYDYSRNIRIQPNVDTLRLFGRSRLSLVNSLVDFRASAGLEISFGLRSLDFRVARWRTEVDQGDIDSYGVGFLMPAGDAADIELRVAYDDSENFGGATVFSFFLYLFDD